MPLAISDVMGIVAICADSAKTGSPFPESKKPIMMLLCSRYNIEARVLWKYELIYKTPRF
jgi:hypothetical protein